MPFDFCNNRHYKINYEELLDELNSLNFLNNKEVQKEFLSKWIEKLKASDEKITRYLTTKDGIEAFNKGRIIEPDIFQKHINFANNDVLIHFRVSAINDIIKNIPKDVKDKYIEILNFTEFTKNDSNFFWTKRIGDVSKYKKCNEPIVLVPFLSGGYLVIDGNHRVTCGVKYKTSITSILILERMLLENRLFVSEFDGLFYFMYNEIHHMYNECVVNNIKAEDVIKKSFLANI